MNLNKAYLIGRLTRDPEMRVTASGQNVAQFGLATNRVWYNEAKQKQESTEFHNIVVWGRLAQVCSQYLKKGGLVLVEGRIQNRSWQAPDGVTKYRSEIVAENIQLGPRNVMGGGNYGPSAAPVVNNLEEVNNMNSGLGTAEGVPTINLDDLGNPLSDNVPEEVSGAPMPF
ncbi:MAG TPA: single-stranded DNA-binding protein [bacterium]|nr:single-stranded DNA-binding protein [bacterium]HPL95671.1 single-stranded DNA-binding protein [bacterium]